MAGELPEACHEPSTGTKHETFGGNHDNDSLLTLLGSVLRSLTGLYSLTAYNGLGQPLLYA